MTDDQVRQAIWIRRLGVGMRLWDPLGMPQVKFGAGVALIAVALDGPAACGLR